jgi:hypothetical protein
MRPQAGAWGRGWRLNMTFTELLLFLIIISALLVFYQLKEIAKEIKLFNVNIDQISEKLRELEHKIFHDIDDKLNSMISIIGISEYDLMDDDEKNEMHVIYHDESKYIDWELKDILERPKLFVVFRLIESISEKVKDILDEIKVIKKRDSKDNQNLID